MSERLTGHGFPAGWVEDFHQRVKDEELVASWRNDKGELLTQEEQEQAAQGLARARQEFIDSSRGTGLDKGEDDD